MVKRCLGLSFLILNFLASGAMAASSEITVDLKLDADDYVVGERIRGVIDVANSSPDKISVGYSNSRDLCFVEVFRANDMSQLERTRNGAFVARFSLETGEGQKLEVFLADHYGLRRTGRYLAKPILVHGKHRFEGSPRVFDVVDGIRIGDARQMFANRDGLQRDFELRYWSRSHSEHLFLLAKDSGSSTRWWETRDLGPVTRIDKPTVSILKTGEIVVLHRLNADQFVRSEFWSLPDALEFRVREAVHDPETAGTARVRELYREGGVKAKLNPWWKFW